MRVRSLCASESNSSVWCACLDDTADKSINLSPSSSSSRHPSAVAASQTSRRSFS